MKISAIVYLFVIHFAVGLTGLMPFVSFKKVGKAFYKYNVLLALSLLVIGLLCLRYAQGLTPQSLRETLVLCSLLGFGGALIGVLVLKSGEYYTRLCLFGAGFGVLAILLDGFSYVPPNGQPWWMGIFVPLSLLSSALILGAVNLAMILGHWYLNIPNLSIQPLKTLTFIYGISLVLRLCLLVLTLWVAGQAESVQIAEAFGQLTSFWHQGLLFGVRILFGLLAPLVFCYMVWESVKLHATQSATGILYAAVVLVIIGELISKYLLVMNILPV